MSNSQGTPPSTTSKDGYIFPIMDDEKEKSYTTKDYTFKKFREFLNYYCPLKIFEQLKN